METKTYLIVIMILLIAGEPIVQHLLKKKYRRQIDACFSAHQWEALEELLNKKIVRFLFSPFDLEYVRLNAGMAQGNRKRIDDQFDLLLRMRLNEQQKSIICLNGFNYYLTENDRKKTSRFYRLVNELKDEQIKRSVRISYDIFVEKGYRYLDEVLASYATCSAEEKYVHEYLLSEMYRNQGDEEQALHFEQLSKAHGR